MGITITCENLRELQEFARGLLGTTDAIMTKAPVQTAPVTAKAEAAAKAEPAVNESSEIPFETDARGKIYSLEDVRAKLADLNKSGKKAAVKNLIQSFGAEKLTAIPEEKYSELMEKAGEL